MWIDKNGRLYTGGGIILDGKRYWFPTDEQFRQAGYTEYVPPPAPPAPENPDFIAVKAAFWGYVDEAAEALSTATGETYTRADFPTGAYSPKLLAWCADHGMSAAATGDLAVKFCAIDADLRRLGKSWEDLFDAEENSDE